MVRAAFVFMVLLLAGCDDGSRADTRTLDVEDEDFRQGQNFYKSGELRKALECYLKVIDKRKGAAESNLEAGRMYLELQDPLPAIYHFNQYIRMKPTSEQSNLVRQLIKTAEKQFMQQLPGRPMEPDALGGSDLNAKLRNLQLENEKLKREPRKGSSYRPRPRARSHRKNWRRPKTASLSVSANTQSPKATPSQASPARSIVMPVRRGSQRSITRTGTR